MLGIKWTSQAAAAALPNTERNEGRKADVGRRTDDKLAPAEAKPHSDNSKLVPVDDLGLWKALQTLDHMPSIHISKHTVDSCTDSTSYRSLESLRTDSRYGGDRETDAADQSRWLSS
jgi:hypothetical protein